MPPAPCRWPKMDFHIHPLKRASHTCVMLPQGGGGGGTGLGNNKKDAKHLLQKPFAISGAALKLKLQLLVCFPADI